MSVFNAAMQAKESPPPREPLQAESAALLGKHESEGGSAAQV